VGSLFSVSRQGDGATIRSVTQGQDFANLTEKFGEAADKSRAALEKFYDSLNDAQKTLINIINQELKLEQNRIDSALKIVDVMQRTDAAFDRFLKSTDYLTDAQDRLRDRLEAIDGGQGSITMNAAQQQQQVENLRKKDVGIRGDLASRGVAIGADQTTAAIKEAMESAGTIFDETNRELIDALIENEKALERETKKTRRANNFNRTFRSGK